MKAAGVTGRLLRYVDRFLRGRQFQVLANGAISELWPVLSGTPQGSGLSPLFFTVFIQDLARMLDAWIKEQEEKGEVVPRGVKKFKAYCFYSMYADDLKLLAAVLDEEDMEMVQEV